MSSNSLNGTARSSLPSTITSTQSTELKGQIFKVAKALREAGYPQDENDERKMRGLPEQLDIPTCLEVRLWLWREKKIAISAKTEYDNNGEVSWCNEWLVDNFADPEEAIIAAIEYLVDNNLIK